MRSVKGLAVLVIVALLAAACDSAQEAIEGTSSTTPSATSSPSPTPSGTPTATPSPPPTPAPTPITTIDPAAIANLDRNREKWDTAGIKDYTFKLSLSCFCSGGQDNTVVVRAGRFSSISDANGQALELATGVFDYTTFVTIEGIFSYAEAVRTRIGVTVTYDPTYGFPTMVDIPPVLPDGNLTIFVGGFQVLDGHK